MMDPKTADLQSFDDIKNAISDIRDTVRNLLRKNPIKRHTQLRTTQPYDDSINDTAMYETRITDNETNEGDMQEILTKVLQRLDVIDEYVQRIKSAEDKDKVDREEERNECKSDKDDGESEHGEGEDSESEDGESTSPRGKRQGSRNNTHADMPIRRRISLRRCKGGHEDTRKAGASRDKAEYCRTSQNRRKTQRPAARTPNGDADATACTDRHVQAEHCDNAATTTAGRTSPSRNDGRFEEKDLCENLVASIQSTVESSKPIHTKGFAIVAMPHLPVRSVNEETLLLNAFDSGFVTKEVRRDLVTDLDPLTNKHICRIQKKPKPRHVNGGTLQYPVTDDIWTDDRIKDCFRKAVRETNVNMPYYIHDASEPSERARLGLPEKSLLHCGQRLAQTHATIPGLHTQFSYINPGGRSLAAIHVEDAGLGSINWVYAGAAKLWLVVPHDEMKKLEGKLKHLFKDTEKCSQFARHLTTPLSPDLLDRWQIRYNVSACPAGHALFTLPGAYHQILNTGPNIAEAINFALEADWTFAPDYRFCDLTCTETPITREDLTIVSKECPIVLDDTDTESPVIHATTLPEPPHLPPAHDDTEAIRKLIAYAMQCVSSFKLPILGALPYRDPESISQQLSRFLPNDSQPQKAWLDDNLLCSVLWLVAPCDSIVLDPQNSKDITFEKNLGEYDLAQVGLNIPPSDGCRAYIWPIHTNKNHWVLVIIDFDTHHIDTFGVHDRPWIDQLYDRVSKLDTGNVWTANIHELYPEGVPQDVQNCGVYCIWQTEMRYSQFPPQSNNPIALRRRYVEKLLEPHIRVASDAIIVGERISPRVSGKRAAEEDISLSKPAKKTALVLPRTCTNTIHPTFRRLSLNSEVPQWARDGFRKFADSYGCKHHPDVEQALITAFQHRGDIPESSAARTLQMVFECVSLQLFRTILEEREYHLTSPDDDDAQSVYRYLMQIRKSERRCHRWLVDVRTYQKHLARYYDALVQRKRVQLNNDTRRRRTAKKRQEKVAQRARGYSAEAIINEEMFGKNRPKSLDKDLKRGRTLNVLGSSMHGNLITLLPSTDVRPRLEFESSYHKLGLPICSNSYDDMDIKHAEYFIQWLPQLRPRLQAFKTTPETLHLLIQADGKHAVTLQQLALEDPSAEDFLEFLANDPVERTLK